MKAFIDFETANSDAVPYEMGLVIDDKCIHEFFNVDIELWNDFNINMHFDTVYNCFFDYVNNKHTLPTAEQIFKQHEELLSSVELWGWNSSTERRAFAIHGVNLNVKCVLKLARSIYGSREKGFYKLENFAKFLEIDVDEDSFHTALYDAKITQDVYNLIKDKETNGSDFLINEMSFKDKSKENAILGHQTDVSFNVAGKVFCATGSFVGFTKADIYARIEELGGTSAKGITKKVTHLIVADTGVHGVTGKIKKALENGIELIHADQFMK